MSTALTVTRQVTQQEDGKWRLQAWINQAAAGVDPYLFVHQEVPTSTAGVNITSRFIMMTTYADTFTIPVQEPLDGGTLFRTRSIDVVWDRLDLLSELWSRMLGRIQEYVIDLAAARGLETTDIETVDIH